MIGHLGSRVSALLDGQLPEQEAERAWQHVHACHQCRDLVEREGWIKTRLAGLSLQSAPAPDHLPEHLKGSLLGGLAALELAGLDDHPSRRLGLGLAAIGGGAVGAAVMGVLALGTAPADAPTIDRRTPVTSVVTPSPTAPAANVRRPGP